MTIDLRSIPCPACGGNVVAAPDTGWALCACGNRVTCEGVAGTEVVTITYEDITRALWRELHLYAVAKRANWSAEYARLWFSNWLSRVPQAGCGCQESFRDKIADLPPVFDSPEQFFEWSVAAHNRVNAKLGKPIISLAAAAEIYSL